MDAWNHVVLFDMNGKVKEKACWQSMACSLANIVQASYVSLEGSATRATRPRQVSGLGNIEKGGYAPSRKPDWTLAAGENALR